MAKRLYTEANVRDLPAGSELVLGKEALATPAALDLAFARGIRVRWGGPAPDGAPQAGAGAAGAARGLEELVRADGTYVLEVRGGKIDVYRLGAAGPEKLASLARGAGS